MAKKTAARRLVNFLLLLVLAYSLLLALLWLFQEKLLFHPGAPTPAGHRYELALSHEEISAKLDGATVHSLFVKANSPAKGVLLFFHGNAGDLRNWGEVAEMIAERIGWDVLIVDYPGFGKSSGSVGSEAQLHAMAEAFFKMARERARGKPVALFGRSIGSGLAVKLAAENEVAGLVLETPYLSLVSVARGMFPWVPPFVLRYPLRSDLWMPLVKAPVLILHGNQDELIPYESGLALSKLVKNGRLVTIEGGRHNDLGGYPGYWKELSVFLKSIAP